MAACRLTMGTNDYISERELQTLGNKFNIRITDTELESLCKQVNQNLSGLERLDRLPLAKSSQDLGERTWWEPNNNPYNAIVVECDVPPKTDCEGTLEGIDVGVKDNIPVANVPFGAGSEVLEGTIPRQDATVIDRIRASGGRISAKTNLDGFAGGGRGVSFKGQITNPHDEAHISGGSSGGSGVAVATDAVDAALGTDTGGSVRIPASHNGIVGLKPTYGLVPLTGIIENTYTIDHVGTMTSTVEDSARLLEAIAGKDRHDPASMQAAGRDEYAVDSYIDAITNPPELDSLSIGILTEGFGEGNATQAVDDRIVKHTKKTIDRLESAGCSFENISIEQFELAATAKYVLSYSELAAHWRDGGAAYRRGGVVDDGDQFSLATRTRALSEQSLSYYRGRLLAGAWIIDSKHGRLYSRANRLKAQLTREFEETLNKYDALILPTLPTLAPTIEEARMDMGYNYARNTIVANITHLPAISLPNGKIDGLPVGLQLIGSPFAESTLLGISENIVNTINTLS